MARESDVTVLVLTIGEGTLERCLRAVRQQTWQAADVVIVRDEVPFSAAFNLGASLVKTPYFLQCDVDMVLDPDCIEVLRGSIAAESAVAIGFLEDPILGAVQAVKLYRSEPIQVKPVPSSIAADSDGVTALLEGGWKLQFARRSSPRPGRGDGILGDHLPAYDDGLYTYQKFRNLGALVRYRGNAAEYFGCLDGLKASRHPAANLALTAFCRGLFDELSVDQHRPPATTRDFDFLSAFLVAENPTTLPFATTRLPGFAYETELRKRGWGI